MSDGPRALSRWSQRKLAARRGAAVPEPGEEAAGAVRPNNDRPAPAQNQQKPAVEMPREETTTRPAADETVSALPPIEELNAQSDYKAFLAKGVPEQLTRAALRKLWTSDPVLANLDGLNNYDEDYNLVDTAITAAQTSYRPGMGYLDAIEDKLAQLDETIGDADRKPPESTSAAGHNEQAQSVSGERGEAPALQSPDRSQRLSAAEPEKAPSEPPEEAET